MAPSFDERLDRMEAEERARSRRLVRPFLLLCLLIAGGIAGALYCANIPEDYVADSGGVTLPRILPKAGSPSRRDLALLDRELLELAIECDKHLSAKPGPNNKKASERYATRLDWQRQTARALEPKLVREETRVLMATQHAVTLLQQFIDGSTDPKTFDHELVEKAIEQLKRASRLASGEPVEQLIVNKANKDLLSSFANLGANLNTIRAARANEQIPQDASNVPGLEKPAKKHHGHKQ